MPYTTPLGARSPANCAAPPAAAGRWLLSGLRQAGSHHQRSLLLGGSRTRHHNAATSHSGPRSPPSPRAVRPPSPSQVRITKMLLGAPPPSFTFAPKHKSNAYSASAAIGAPSGPGGDNEADMARG